MMTNKEEQQEINPNIDKVKRLWNEKNKITTSYSYSKLDKIVKQVADFFAPGKFYYYVFNFATNEMDFVHPNFEKMFGIPLDQYSMDTLLSLYHPDDLDMMWKKENLASDFYFNFLEPQDIINYKCVYTNRMKGADGKYFTILHQAKAINMSQDGKIARVLGVHADITYLKPTLDSKVSFISDNKPSYYSLDPNKLVLEQFKKEGLYTNRELEIISLLAAGKSADEIAVALFLSVHTIKSHKKNILNKSNAANTTQLVAECIRNGII